MGPPSALHQYSDKLFKERAMSLPSYTNPRFQNERHWVNYQVFPHSSNSHGFAQLESKPKY